MVQRMGMVIGVVPEKLDEYKRLHAEPWPEMNAALSAANIRNYSIFLREPENLLFGYWEYVGQRLRRRHEDARRTRDHPALACPHRPLPGSTESAPDTEWWSSMPEVYHLD